MKPIAHKNNFNFLRLLFASLVVFSHAYALLGQEEPTLWGRSLGNLSVHGFFVISGYLICQSYVRSPTLISFSINRLLRIGPGLVVAMIVTKLIADLCGGFKANPVPYIANGPVWTLTWEVACYFCLAILGLIGILQTTRIPSFFAAAWLAFLVNISSTSDSYLVIAPLAIMFLAGSFIAVMEREIDFQKIPLIGILGLAAITNYGVFQSVYGWIVAHIPFLWGPNVTAEQASRVIYMATFPLIVIYIGKLARPVLNIENDVSYGVYIYGWPTAQALAYLAIQRQITLSPIAYFALTMALTLPIAFASWKLVEKPFLSLKRFFIRGKRSGLKPQGATN